MDIRELQEKIKALKEVRARYDEKKEQLAVEKEILDSLEADIIQAFEENDLTSFKLDGVANVSITHRLTVPTPKTVDEKRAFFAWVAANKGEEVRDAMMTVNSMTLNSFYKEEYNNLSDDDKLLFQIDGIGAPSMMKSLSVRKA